MSQRIPETASVTENIGMLWLIVWATYYSKLYYPSIRHLTNNIWLIKFLDCLIFKLIFKNKRCFCRKEVLCAASVQVYMRLSQIWISLGTLFVHWNYFSSFQDYFLKNKTGRAGQFNVFLQYFFFYFKDHKEDCRGELLIDLIWGLHLKESQNNVTFFLLFLMFAWLCLGSSRL